MHQLPQQVEEEEVKPWAGQQGDQPHPLHNGIRCTQLHRDVPLQPRLPTGHPVREQGAGYNHPQRHGRGRGRHRRIQIPRCQQGVLLTLVDEGVQGGGLSQEGSQGEQRPIPGQPHVRHHTGQGHPRTIHIVGQCKGGCGVCGGGNDRNAGRGGHSCAFTGRGCKTGARLRCARPTGTARTQGDEGPHTHPQLWTSARRLHPPPGRMARGPG